MAVAGLRGSGSYNSDERPKNYRGVLLLINPNTQAPLTAFTGQMRNEMTDDPEFKIFEKDLPSQRATVSGTPNSTITTINLQGSNNHTIFRAGHAVMNERTGEVVWVASTATDLIVTTRGQGSTAAAMQAGDGLLILGTHHAEGASLPAAVTYDPSVITNQTQIFRNVLDITGTGAQVRLRYADNPMVELKREILEIHAIEMEKQFFFGSGVAGSGATPERTTKGLFFYITTNVTDAADAVDIDTWENALEDLFENGSDEKMLFCGNRMLNVINKAARTWGHLQLTPQSETFGTRIMNWVTPFGSLQIKQHPLFSRNATFNDWGFGLDMPKVVYRFLRGRDTQYLENRQSPGDDARKDEFLTEAGLELQFEKCHAMFKNFSTYVP